MVPSLCALFSLYAVIVRAALTLLLNSLGWENTVMVERGQMGRQLHTLAAMVQYWVQT